MATVDAVRVLACAPEEPVVGANATRFPLALEDRVCECRLVANRLQTLVHRRAHICVGPPQYLRASALG